MYLGIDLGTSNSAIVGYVEGDTRLFKSADGADVLPSAIYLDRRGHRFVGKAAYDRAISAPKSVAMGFKRLMGTKSPVDLGGESWTPEQCSAEIIKTLVSQATSEMPGVSVDGAVITTPAAFNQMQCEATIEAAKSAGLERVSLLQEPVAAAMAAIAKSSFKDGVFLIYDLGGGTFDVALVLSTSGAVNVVAHEGINMLGGRDFDRRVFDSVVRPWLVETFNLPDHFQKDERFRHLADVCRHAIERAKIQLSSSETASVFASEDEIRMQDLDGEEIYVSVDLTRSDLEGIVRDRVEDSIALCRKIIADNGYRNEDVTKIVPIGGPSKMPIIRDMLQQQLAIDVETGLDPMTAVAVGAAIFAESRSWDGDQSARKTARGQALVDGDVDLKLDFVARTSDDSVRLRVTPGKNVPDGCSIEVLDEEGSSSGKMSLDGPVRLSLSVRKSGVNRYKVRVTAPDGREIETASRDIEVVKVQSSAAAIPMTYNLAVKVQEGQVGYERNKLNKLIAKNTQLPAQGVQEFRAAKTIKAGENANLTVEFFEMVGNLDDPERNLHIGDFRLSGMTDLDRGERIDRGDTLKIHWTMSDNLALAFSVEIPSLGRMIDVRNLYFVDAARLNYEGELGSEIANSLLERAEEDLNEIEDTLGGETAETSELRKRIERQHSSLSTSIDSDTHRSVSEEARKLRQDVALLARSPANEERVLSREVSEAEETFDDIRASASQVEIERHEKLLVTARRLIRERDFDGARNALHEMKSIRFKALFNDPGFLVGIFENLQNDRHLSMDHALHDKLVETGKEAIASGDVEMLRAAIGGLISNRINTGSDADEIVALSDIFAA
ncbi:Hsp70 family protein [Pseudooceanicola nitratireducens]|uniref:Hsp70 family protein n=1 Tax=Pseudooceanicola nitratireducens TaxID=517719 RepID=UPI001C950F4B|nr:Hsp70 family protein [Pseudooceanicola nitratireducens]MBY6164844.1 Hsp70 family protein [Pseudooceanicola nitratireducens]